jgi:hypothetical protein
MNIRQNSARSVRIAITASNVPARWREVRQGHVRGPTVIGNC